MIDQIRSKAYDVLRSSVGNRLMPVRVARGALSFVNDMLGRPLAPEDEIAERRDYEQRRRARLKQLEAKREAEAVVTPKAVIKENAPVVVYTDGRAGRDLQRVSEVLKGRDIGFTVLSVEDDHATRSWVTSTAHTQDFPVVFIGGTPIGGFNQLVQLDAAGDLIRRVRGQAHP
jgi:glutaredoxin